MDKQLSFAQAEYAGKKKATRRDVFLAKMERVVPWARLVALIEPCYPKGQRGRPPIGVEKMLRMYFLQQWYGLSDALLEDSIYDSQAMRAFMGVDVVVPDATTLLGFRHLLEAHGLTAKILAEVNAHLAEQKLLMKEGTIVDATIIAAPSSTKNKQNARDPEMHQTKKGNTWHFGLKAHVGVDAASGLVHTVKATAANVSDVSQTHHLLHGQEKDGYSDAGYQGVEKRPEMLARKQSMTWHIAAKRGRIKRLMETPYKEAMQALEKVKAQVRALVEHPFHVVKNLFKHRKARYRGLAKNEAQLFSLFALANLVLAGRQLQAELRP